MRASSQLGVDDTVDLMPPAPITTARQKKLKERAENAAAIRPPSPKRMTTDFKPELLEFEEKEELEEQPPYEEERPGESSDYSPSEGEEEAQTPRAHLKRPLSESAEVTVAIFVVNVFRFTRDGINREVLQTIKRRKYLL